MGRVAEWVDETTTEAMDAIFDWNESAYETMCDEIGADWHYNAARYIQCENMLFESPNDRLPMKQAALKAIKSIIEAAYGDVEMAQETTGYEPDYTFEELTEGFDKLSEFLLMMP